MQPAEAAARGAGYAIKQDLQEPKRAENTFFQSDLDPYGMNGILIADCDICHRQAIEDDDPAPKVTFDERDDVAYWKYNCPNGHEITIFND